MEYLLTMMCASTRFPEAIPMRNITTKSVVKALVKFFTLVGLPRWVQSDQGSNFTSNCFKQVMELFGIEHLVSSAYHPESQGALERYHQTLKTMMRAFCFDHDRDWDTGCYCLPHVKLSKSRWDSVLSTWFSDTLFGDHSNS